MTQAVAQILTEVERLSAAERAELRRAILERTPMSGDLTDEDFGALAAEAFRALDDEEASRLLVLQLGKGCTSLRGFA